MDREAAQGDPPEQGPTYFEIITAAALCHFARRQVDAAVLEVGLGGRLDSTNVCTPCVSIITSISFDHVKQLGHTLAAIAAEKAGIIKPGVPVISGVTADEPREVVRQIARQNGCRLVELGVDFDFEYHPPRHLDQAPSPAHFDFRYLVPPADFSDIALGLLGRHQAANAALVLAAVGRTAAAAVGRSPRRRFAGDWPRWSGRRGWRSSRGGRRWCSMRPTTPLPSRRWSRCLARVFPPGGDG